MVNSCICCYNVVAAAAAAAAVAAVVVFAAVYFFLHSVIIQRRLNFAFNNHIKNLCKQLQPHFLRDINCN